MNSSRLLTIMLALFTGAATLAAIAAAPAHAAQAAPQPCTASYSNSGGIIASNTVVPVPTPPADPAERHTLRAIEIQVPDSRVVTDIHVSADLKHPDAAGLALFLRSPQTEVLAPNMLAMNVKQAAGLMDGVYSFDEEVGTGSIVGTNPAPATYRPVTAEGILEGHPAIGKWSLWILNYSAQAGDISNFTLTLTYATCDSDGDGVDDSVDNCVTVPNDQTNSDDDALGDACDLDTDGDNIANSGDGCPTVASANPTGCPTATRKARLRYVKGKHKLQVRITSPETTCVAKARIVLWRARTKRDVRLVVGTANRQGVYRAKVPRGARYYVTVSPSYASGVAECTKATSRTVRVPRRR